MVACRATNPYVPIDCNHAAADRRLPVRAAARRAAAARARPVMKWSRPTSATVMDAEVYVQLTTPHYSRDHDDGHRRRRSVSRPTRSDQQSSADAAAVDWRWISATCSAIPAQGPSSAGRYVVDDRSAQQRQPARLRGAFVNWRSTVSMTSIDALLARRSTPACRPPVLADLAGPFSGVLGAARQP